jgi:hypothetical protein
MSVEKGEINLSHIDTETKNELNKQLRNLSILIPTNQKNILSLIIKKHILSNFDSIKIITVELENLNRIENILPHKDDILTKIQQIYKYINNIKLTYEILFVKEEINIKIEEISKNNIFVSDSNGLNFNRDHFNQHKYMLNFKIDDDKKYISLNIFLELILNKTEDLIKKVNEKIEYYDNGKNNKLFYYTFGYLSWICNWFNRYKTIHKSYTDYLLYRIKSIQDRVITIRDTHKTNLSKMSVLSQFVKDMELSVETVTTNVDLHLHLANLIANINLQSVAIKEGLFYTVNT